MTDMIALAEHLEDMTDRLRAKMPEGATVCELEVRINYCSLSPLRFYTGIGTLPEGFPTEGSFETEEDLLAHLEKVDLFIKAMPSREHQAKLLAGRDLGKAIDKARDAGLEVDGIATSFAGIWENLIEHKP